MKAIILAGGFATRLWPLTERTAKSLLRIGNKPILSFLVEKVPPDIPIIVSTNRVFAEDFMQWKEEESAADPDRDITIFIEDSENEAGKKGALSAVTLVLETLHITDDILVLAGDNLFFFDMKQFLEHATSHPLLAAYDVGSMEEAKKFGVLVPGEKGFVTEFQEKPNHPKSTLVSTGCLYFPHKRVSDLIDFSRKQSDDLGGVFEYYLGKNIPVQYFSFTENWFDVGSFFAFLEASLLILGEGVHDVGSARARDNIYTGSVCLEKNTVVENSTLHNVIVQEGSTLVNVHIRDSIIGKNSVLRNTDISGIALREESFVEGEKEE